jgi:hypothetical protein
VSDYPQAEGPSPFPASINITLDVYRNSIFDALPTYDATIYGVEDLDAFYLVDFDNPNTLVWGVDCVQGNDSLLDVGAPCSDSPVNIITSFNASSNS